MSAAQIRKFSVNAVHAVRPILAAGMVVFLWLLAKGSWAAEPLQYSALF
ncbi:MAG TPA: hypothetical protein H9894_07770 [Candidatus Desulfovibrio intestinipullorum]|uniref:Uncharacterized protein n=1 Tax=Candidatus Desulfovibrio intestinipullorum TaxID=2838536 RepID=A0A9D1TPV4_9BACT|nr:hypothetical protein [Candidatus Desulfovibrio intestinipullorum]